MAAFCERPAVLISKTSNCNKGSVCCDNSRIASTQKPRPQTTKATSPPTTTSPPDPREDCPGSCIVSLLSFTCFRNAEMTDLFKCKKSGTQVTDSFHSISLNNESNNIACPTVLCAKNSNSRSARKERDYAWLRQSTNPTKCATIHG